MFLVDRRLAGLNKNKAVNILEWRARNKRFRNREELLQCKGIGKKTYEQCVGFLRVLPPADQADCSSGSHGNERRRDAVEVADSDDEEEEVGKKRKKQKTNERKGKKARRSSQDRAEYNHLDKTFIHPESYGIAER